MVIEINAQPDGFQVASCRIGIASRSLTEHAVSRL